jgi:endogenous inhibitor of DNA gyrase (YacG/DUF329 family)
MGKGGSRPGAGRPAQYRKTLNFWHIDVRRLQRDDLLKEGMVYGWLWRDKNAEELASINVQIVNGAVRFSYRTGSDYDVKVLVGLTETACNYGGLRKWFICPYCSQRCALLYLGRQVACRKCLKLKYPSQSDDQMDASWRRQYKLEEKLGGRGRWRKPKGMHQSTFDSIRMKILEEDLRREVLLVRQCRRFFGKDFI